MTEVENLKAKLFELVECVGALENKPKGDVITFTKEQLLSYSKFLIDETISSILSSIQTGIEHEIDGRFLDEAIELSVNHHREINVEIDERAIQHQIISIIEDSIGGDVEILTDSALNHVFIIKK